MTTAQDPATTHHEREPGSFRDPGGFVYRRDGILYRQVNRSYEVEWRAVCAAGILEAWQGSGHLITHEAVDIGLAASPELAIDVIRPRPISFISYPYEWTFGQLKDAALLTIDLQKDAESRGFTLRDASAYNIQYEGARPVLIDSLSVERLDPNLPWAAYRQFCQHFVAPLALMAHRDVRCGLLLRDFIEGIPLDLAATLLPGRTRLSAGLGSHVHLHARAQRNPRFTSGSRPDRRPHSIGPTRRAALLDNLRGTIEGLRWNPGGTVWADYDRETSYSGAAMQAKEAVVEAMLRAAPDGAVWDLGANVGRFSAVAARLGRPVIAWDVDAAASERHYQRAKADGGGSILPLVQDVMNPSPPIGWALEERRSLVQRSNAAVLMALALVHHLALANNVPLEAIAAFFAQLAPNIIVEFVPKSDPMGQVLLASRRDIFPDYTQAGFEGAFERHFRIVERTTLPASPRILYRMRRLPGSPG